MAPPHQSLGADDAAVGEVGLGLEVDQQLVAVEGLLEVTGDPAPPGAVGVQLGDDRLIDLRDRTLLLVGYAGGMRRAELAGLDTADVDSAPEGLLVHLRRSKTDPEARGRRIEIVYGAHPDTCPVRAYRTWTRAAGLAEGAVFRRVDRHGRIGGPLSAQGVAIVVKRHMGRLGHP